MLVKCNYSDKLHLCTSQERWSTPGVTWADQLTEAIVSSIPEETKLRDLFVKWCALRPDERLYVDENINTRERFDLYLPLKRALGHWETIQDTQGAPGFEAGVYGFTCDPHLEEELTNIVCRIETVIDRILLGNSPVGEKPFNLLEKPAQVPQPV
uniref:Ribonuclease S-2 n=1 Tax=Lygus hesperus TaxID=30085 RepID=A0A0A9YXI8_LYGHE